MEIGRVIKAIQRNSNLSSKQMRQQFPEIFELEFTKYLEEIRWESRLSASSKIAEIRRLACPLTPQQRS